MPQYSGPTLPAAGNQTTPGLHHRVEAGQTLWRISRIYNIDIDDILRLNHIPADAKIEIGQVLLIPGTLQARPKETVFKAAGDDFIWPLRGKIISGLGRGINIQAVAANPVVASRRGRVVFYADNFGNYGKTIILDHGDGLRSVYSRFSQLNVRLGDVVERGAMLGRLGNSKRDRNNYLHFEIRKGQLSQNPLFYLP